jgi:hypothetical protein
MVDRETGQKSSSLVNDDLGLTWRAEVQWRFCRRFSELITADQPIAIERLMWYA